MGKYFNHMSEIKVACTSLKVGATDNSLACPACGKKGSFGVTRKEEGLVYNCFRVACGIKGFISSKGGVIAAQPKQEKKVKPLKKYLGDRVPIPKDIYSYLEDTYSLTKKQVDEEDWQYSGLTHRLIMGGYSYFGKLFVKVAKKLPKSPYLGNKATSYFEEHDQLKLAFTNVVGNGTSQGTVVVVEDMISCKKVSSILPAVALLGTHITKLQIAFLAAKFSHLVMMLDPDAQNKALSYQKEYGGMFESFRVVALDKDPKDTPYNVLEKELIV